MCNVLANKILRTAMIVVLLVMMMMMLVQQVDGTCQMIQEFKYSHGRRYAGCPAGYN
jgi:hypothetical protein